MAREQAVSSSRNDKLAARGRAFDAWSAKHEKWLDWGIRVHPLWGPRLRKAVDQIRGPRVLEVSFGTGYLMSLYADRFDVTGVDYNPRMLETATRRLGRLGLSAQLLLGDAHALPFPDDSFDCLVNTDAFTLYRDPKQAMSEFYRVLKPGGRLVLQEYDLPKDRNWLGMKLMWIAKLFTMPYVEFPPLLSSVGFEFEDHDVGMSGMLHMFVATKPLTASGTASTPARS